MINLNIELPDGFLEEEELSGYLVTSDMKEIWAVELDLLAEFDRVCKKYGITYFADAGTMLGAIRHQGFIPWDDDIDVTLSRDSYNKLCEVASREFTGDYFFQTEYTDKGSLRGHAQLRNSATTGILKSELGQYSFNQGIFIDIFPYDVVTDDREKFEKQKREAEHLKKKFKRRAKFTDFYSNMSFEFPKNIVAPIVHWYYEKFTKKDYDDDYKKFEAVCTQYNNEQSEKISLLSFSFDDIHFQTRSDYEEVEYVPFEFMTIPVPKGYHHALTERFGDYNIFVKGGSYHGGVIFDTDRSYIDYLENYNK